VHGCLKIESEVQRASAPIGVTSLHARGEAAPPSTLTIRLSRSFAAFSASRRCLLGGVSSSGLAPPVRNFPRGVILSEEEVLAFVHTEIGSVWALELLLFLKASPEKSFGLEELVLQQRSSSTAVAQALTRLKVSGFADVRPDGTYAFAPGSSRHREMAEAIETLSLQKPMTLIKATAEIPDEKLRNFSDAFKFRDQS